MANIKEVLLEMRDTYRSETNPVNKLLLRDQFDKALNAVLLMTEEIIGDNTAAYNIAVQALEESITELKKARRELEGVAENIVKVAKAVDLIVDVAKKVAGA